MGEQNFTMKQNELVRIELSVSPGFVKYLKQATPKGAIFSEYWGFEWEKTELGFKR